MAVFWGVSVSLYLNRPWTRWIWRLCRARDGRDWMLNSGVLRIDQRARRPGHARGQRGAVRLLPATGCGAAGATGGGRDRGALPARRARQGPLRVVLPARGRPGAPARRLDPPHHPPAPRAARRPARSGARYSDAGGGSPVRGQGDAAGARLAGGLDRDRRQPFGPAGAHGRARAPRAARAAWELAMRGDAEPLRHLPREWMYRAPLPRTKLESPLPSAVFDGRPSRSAASAVDRRRAGPGWPATTGAPSTRRPGSGCTASPSTDEPGAWLDLSVGRVRVGPVLTPWIANGAVHVGGRADPPRRAAARRACTRRPEGCRVELPRRRRRGALRPPGRPSPGPTPTPAAASTTRSTARSPRCTVRAAATASCAPPTAASTSTAWRRTRHGIALQPFPDG